MRRCEGGHKSCSNISQNETSKVGYNTGLHNSKNETFIKEGHKTCLNIMNMRHLKEGIIQV